MAGKPYRGTFFWVSYERLPPWGSSRRRRVRGQHPRVNTYQLTDKLQFEKTTPPPKGGGVAIYGENYQTFIFPDHSKSLMNKPPITVRFWKWM